MLKQKLCEATFKWKLACSGPLLIADGRYEYDRIKERAPEKGKLPHKVFISHARRAEEIEQAVLSRSADTLGLRFYVPGTSLRGPFRAQAERITRSLLPEAAPPSTACDPFDMGDGGKACSRLLTDHAVDYPYAVACPACKLFGCTATASRIRFSDADVDGGISVYRDMIGIDRFTGGVFQGVGGGANMRFHALEGVKFTTSVLVTNFELWQLGLLAYVFRDFAEGLVPIGFGKTKGFGQVTGEVESLVVSYPAGRCTGEARDLGSMMSDDEKQRYAIFDSTPIQGLSRCPPTGLNLYEQFTPDNMDDFMAATAAAFNAFINECQQSATVVPPKEQQ